MAAFTSSNSQQRAQRRDFARLEHHRAPRRERRRLRGHRQAHRRAHLVGNGAGDLGESPLVRLGGRIDDLNMLGRSGIDPRSVDLELQGVLHHWKRLLG